MLTFFNSIDFLKKMYLLDSIARTTYQFSPTPIFNNNLVLVYNRGVQNCKIFYK